MDGERCALYISWAFQEKTLDQAHNQKKVANERFKWVKIINTSTYQKTINCNCNCSLRANYEKTNILGLTKLVYNVKTTFFMHTYTHTEQCC